MTYVCYILWSLLYKISTYITLINKYDHKPNIRDDLNSVTKRLYCMIDTSVNPLLFLPTRSRFIYNRVNDS